MTQWEYKTLTFDFRRFLAQGEFDSRKFDEKAIEMGVRGWELVNVFDTNADRGGTH